MRAYLDQGKNDSADRRNTAKHLLDLANLVWGADHQAPVPELAHQGPAYAVGDFLAAVADDTRPLEVPSPLLTRYLAEYKTLHEKVDLLTQSKGERPNSEGISRLLSELRGALGWLPLPTHEVGLLRHLYQGDIARIEGFRDALGSLAQIAVRVRNPWLDRDVEQQVSVEVENQGTDTANNMELTIEVQDGSTDCIPVRQRGPEPLHPGTWRGPLTFSRSFNGPTVQLRAAWHYQDGRGADRSGHKVFNLAVHSPRAPREIQRAQPYEAGIAVFGRKRFFGREAELGKVFSMLVAGITQPILLRGPRRMGKTSLMLQIQWLLDNPGELAKYRLEADEAALRLIRPVFTNLQDLTETGPAAVIQFLDELLRKIGKALASDRPVSLPERAPHPVGAFRRTLDELLQQGGGLRPLVMVDEWDEVTRPRMEGLARNLRSLMLEEQRVNWMISSTWMMRHEGRNSSSPLHNMCDIMEIRDVDRETATRIVLGRSKYFGLDWHGWAVVAAADQTGQWPYLIQMLGAEAVDLLIREHREPLVEIETVRAVIGRMVRGDLARAETLFRSIYVQRSPSGDDGDAVRALGWWILWVLNQAGAWVLNSEGENALSKTELMLAVAAALPQEIRNDRRFSTWFDTEFDDQFQLLDEVHYVIKADEAQRYRIRVPIFRDWFNHSAQRLHPEMADRLGADLARAAGSRP